VDRARLRCVHCRYALRGSVGASCPECGTPVEASWESAVQVVHARLRPVRYGNGLHRVNLLLCLLPAMVVTAIAGLFVLTGLPELALLAAAWSVTSVTFAPILALITMPYRGSYEDAEDFSLRGRGVLLLAVWTGLLTGILWLLGAGV
jgi:hypothetical protein